MTDIWTTHHILPHAEEPIKCSCLWRCVSPPSPIGIFWDLIKAELMLCSFSGWALWISFSSIQSLIFMKHARTYYLGDSSHLSNLVIISQQMKKLWGERHIHTHLYTHMHTHKHRDCLSLISLGNQIKNSIDVNNEVLFLWQISVPFKPILPVRRTAKFSTGTRPDR